MPAADPQLPEQFGRYRIVGRLGQGGMGAVYLAEDTELGRRVALKVPSFSNQEGPEVLERFSREARAAAILEHPNICRIYDVGEINGIKYLTMAYVDGRPLTDYIHGPKLMPERAAAMLARKLALALQAAHERGIIHRDLKPANILINQWKEPIIVDFGLARRVQQGDSLTEEGMVLGTPAYMPPEQVSGQPEDLGPTCDIYSLGVILYEMLTGQRPFQGPPAAVLAQIATQPPDPPSIHRKDLDPQLENICLKAMAKKAKDRYGSTADLAMDLSTFLRAGSKGEIEPSLSMTAPVPARPIRAEPSRTAPMTSPSASKRSLLPRIIIGLAIVLVICLAVSSLGSNVGTIQIALSNPDAAVEIQVDGRPIEGNLWKQPLQLTVGKHELAILSTDSAPRTRSFYVRRGINPPLQIELPELVLVDTNAEIALPAEYANAEPAPETPPAPPEASPAEPPPPILVQSDSGPQPQPLTAPSQDNRFVLQVLTKTGIGSHAGAQALVTLVLNNDESLKKEGMVTFPRGATQQRNLDFDYPVEQVRTITIRYRGKNAWFCQAMEFRFFKDGILVGRWIYFLNCRFSSEAKDHGRSSVQFTLR